MIQPGRQDQTDLFQRKEAWVADREGEEKQTELELSKSHSCWAAGGWSRSEQREPACREQGAHDQFIFPEVKCIDLNRNPAYASKAPEKH